MSVLGTQGARAPRHAVAATLWVALASSMLGACDDTPAASASAARAPVVPGLGILFEHQSTEKLVGAEAFEVTLRTNRVWGTDIIQYGLKTPYENAMHEVRPRLPVPILDGDAVIRDVVFDKVPMVGVYPYEFWLVTEDGVESNHVFGKITVQ